MACEFTRLFGMPRFMSFSTGEIKMGKAETSARRKKSAKRSLKIHKPFTSDLLKNKEEVIDTLLDCIRTGDIASFREVLVAHLMTVNKVELAQRAGIGRRTIYDLLDSKKEFNPGLQTVSALIQALAS